MLLDAIKTAVKAYIPVAGNKIKRGDHVNANDTMISALYYSDWGIPKPYFSNVLPEGYVWCNVQGQTVNIADCHPDFVSIMGPMYPVYGGVPGETIGIPYIPGGSSLVQAGTIVIGTNFTTISLGATGGEAGHTLTKAELPSGSYGYIGDFGDGWPDSSNDRTTVGSTNSYVRKTKQLILGSDQAHNNMPPYFVVNYILRIK